MADLESLVRESAFAVGLIASFIGGTLATAAGALPALFLRSLRAATGNDLLSFAAGIMLAATVFSLLIPSLSLAQAQLGGPAAAGAACIFALLLGGVALWLLHRIAPHEHFTKGHEGPGGARWPRVWLFVAAMTIHNFPEGLSIGVSAGSQSLGVLLPVTAGIGLQNLPEGLAVAMALRAEGYARHVSFGTAALSGAVETVGGVIGVGLTAISAALLPGALAFAAGAMLFVVSNEVIPETHRAGAGARATASLMLGFALMMFLDTALAGLVGAGPAEA